MDQSKFFNLIVFLDEFPFNFSWVPVVLPCGILRFAYEYTSAAPHLLWQVVAFWRQRVDGAPLCHAVVRHLLQFLGLGADLKRGPLLQLLGLSAGLKHEVHRRSVRSAYRQSRLQEDQKEGAEKKPFVRTIAFDGISTPTSTQPVLYLVSIQ